MLLRPDTKPPVFGRAKNLFVMNAHKNADNSCDLDVILSENLENELKKLGYSDNVEIEIHTMEDRRLYVHFSEGRRNHHFIATGTDVNTWLNAVAAKSN